MADTDGTCETDDKVDAARIPSIKDETRRIVIGFAAASLVYSFLVDANVVKQTKAAIGAFRTSWFAMAFVSIGLETKFRDLLTMEEGRPFYAFLTGQAANVIWTLLLAYAIFGGYFFAAPRI